MKYVYLISAVALSVAAAFMSVVGLNKIFPGILWPFIILEGAKFIAAIYLHTYWKSIGIAMKAYMVSGVAVLMIMTSAGIYGYLSNSAMTHTSGTVSTQTQVEFFDDKIKALETRRNEVNSAKARLDSVVDGYANLNDQNAAVRAATVFSRQKETRQTLDAQIAQIDKEILEAKSSLATAKTDLNKIRAEIGPGVYLANAFYGDSSIGMIERAIQIVILLIVFTFDPMAVVMMINAAKLFENASQKQEATDKFPCASVLPEVPVETPKPKRKYTRKKKVENAITLDSVANESVVEPVQLSILPDPVEPNTGLAATTDESPKAKRLRRRKSLIDEAIQRVDM